MYPKNENGIIDKDAVRQMFFESKFCEWVPFAESKGWNPSRSRSDFPVNQWIEEKKKVLAEEAMERLSEDLFGKNSQWHREVLDFLSLYPKTCDKIKSILEKRINEMLSDENADMKELLTVTRIVKTLTEAKYKALMIDKWDFDLPEQAFKKFWLKNEEAKPFQVEIMNMGKITTADLEQIFEKYLDKPKASSNGEDLCSAGEN